MRSMIMLLASVAPEFMHCADRRHVKRWYGIGCGAQCLVMPMQDMRGWLVDAEPTACRGWLQSWEVRGSMQHAVPNFGIGC